MAYESTLLHVIVKNWYLSGFYQMFVREFLATIDVTLSDSAYMETAMCAFVVYPGRELCYETFNYLRHWFLDRGSHSVCDHFD